MLLILIYFVKPVYNVVCYLITMACLAVVFFIILSIYIYYSGHTEEINSVKNIAIQLFKQHN